jgi:hypothetical protein
MTDTTRIMDLPENITMQMNPTTRGDGINTSYSPMDMHPNPYGHPPPSVPSMPTPSSQNQQALPPPQMQPQHQQMAPGPGFSVPQQPQLQEQYLPPNQATLPSRDIPIDTTDLVQDVQVQPNYVPPVSNSVQKTADYMKQYDAINEEKIRSHRAQQSKESYQDSLLEALQLPILVGLLFLLFQLPLIDRMIFQRLSFLNIHNSDGNYNTNGILLRSVLFGALFYGIQYIRGNLI